MRLGIANSISNRRKVLVSNDARIMDRPSWYRNEESNMERACRSFSFYILVKEQGDVAWFVGMKFGHHRGDVARSWQSKRLA